MRVPFILLLAPHRKGPHLCLLLPRQGAALEVSRIASSEGAAVRGTVGCSGSEARLRSPAPWVRILAPLFPCHDFLQVIYLLCAFVSSSVKGG